MGEIDKTVGQLLISNCGWIVIIILFIVSSIFKIAKKEIDPFGWVVGTIGKAFTKDVRKDVSDLKEETAVKFKEIKTDRSKKVDELKADYNKQITDLRKDLDSFEERTNSSIDEMKCGTAQNCEILKGRLDKMEDSNDLQSIRQIKAHVLDFANSCMNKRRHTKQEFENIIHENEEYETLFNKLQAKYPDLKNDVYTDDFKYIMKIYHECRDNGTFLNEGDS